MEALTVRAIIVGVLLAVLAGFLVYLASAYVFKRTAARNDGFVAFVAVLVFEALSVLL